MKKKLLSFLMVLALVIGNVAVVSAAEAADAPTVKDEDLTAVTGAEAIAAIGTENTIFLDLRAAVVRFILCNKLTQQMAVCVADNWT